jgi:hypothetical protein
MRLRQALCRFPRSFMTELGPKRQSRNTTLATISCRRVVSIQKLAAVHNARKRRFIDPGVRRTWKLSLNSLRHRRASAAKLHRSAGSQHKNRPKVTNRRLRRRFSLDPRPSLARDRLAFDNLASGPGTLRSRMMPSGCRRPPPGKPFTHGKFQTETLPFVAVAGRP